MKYVVLCLKGMFFFRKECEDHSIGEVSFFDTTQLIDESKGYGSHFILSKYIRSTLENFICSSEPKMTCMHVKINHVDFEEGGVPSFYEKKVCVSL